MREKIGRITLSEGVNLGYVLGLLGHLSDYFEIEEAGAVVTTETTGRVPGRAVHGASNTQLAPAGYDDHALGLNPLDDL